MKKKWPLWRVFITETKVNPIKQQPPLKRIEISCKRRASESKLKQMWWWEKRLQDGCVQPPKGYPWKEKGGKIRAAPPLPGRWCPEPSALGTPSAGHVPGAGLTGRVGVTCWKQPCQAVIAFAPACHLHMPDQFMSTGELQRVYHQFTGGKHTASLP